MYVDNGDNKCFAYIINENSKKNFNFVADFFYPTNGSINIMIAG